MVFHPCYFLAHCKSGVIVWKIFSMPHQLRRWAWVPSDLMCHGFKPHLRSFFRSTSFWASLTPSHCSCFTTKKFQNIPIFFETVFGKKIANEMSLWPKEIEKFLGPENVNQCKICDCGEDFSPPRNHKFTQRTILTFLTDLSSLNSTSMPHSQWPYHVHPLFPLFFLRLGGEAADFFWDKNRKILLSKKTDNTFLQILFPTDCSHLWNDPFPLVYPTPKWWPLGSF